MRIDRMLAITVMLLNRHRISARELADKFEVSIRTVYRDIEAINMAGIPVVSFSGNNGGFGILDTYKLDRQLLTLNDMTSILAALKGVNTTLEDRELDTTIEKIQNLVPKDKEKHVQQHLEQVVIDITPLGYTKRQKARLQIVQQATTRSRLLEFEYRNSRGETVTRIVEPLTLLFKGYAWYLYAFCRLKNDYRLFRLSRMKDPKMLEQEFIRKEKSYQEFGTFEPDTNKWTRLVLKFSPNVRFRVEDYFEDESIEIQPNGDLIVTITTPEDDWVYSLILGYCEHVEVLEPDHVRDIIKQKAYKIFSHYSQT
ncbi:YafY family transcriptional regulator [candidate division KSB1 bacterium]|nr:YafY family transcriptional regulator [candidate division KSB1 bacterium]